jgi:hypothetical protein
MHRRTDLFISLVLVLVLLLDPAGGSSPRPAAAAAYSQAGAIVAPGPESPEVPATAMGTGFTYQGQLN